MEPGRFRSLRNCRDPKRQKDGLGKNRFMRGKDWALARDKGPEQPRNKKLTM